MRKVFLVAALAGTAMTLSACSQGAEDAAERTVEDTSMDAGAGEVTDAQNAGGVADANTATAAQLAERDGISPELAAAIVAGQPYESVTDLNAALVAAATPEEATAALSQVFVPVNLNSASREEIALIPGMTDRMVGEFLEYRPYADMSEFDREIGKYVNEAELARFRNYVTL
jgi:DNA uptake protein ComE-like DNA-binding protein